MTLKLYRNFSRGTGEFCCTGTDCCRDNDCVIVPEFKACFITLLAVVPITVVLSEWFGKKSSNAYRIVRNKISDVLSDLQESLAGIRVITAHNRRAYNVAKHTNIVGEHKDANLDAVKAASIATSRN